MRQSDYGKIFVLAQLLISTTMTNSLGKQPAEKQSSNSGKHPKLPVFYVPDFFVEV